MQIPLDLLTQIREAKVALFLGAGASIGAVNSKGESPPTGRQLAKLLADRFLGATYLDAPLHIVAELAISESDLPAVQDFIRGVFEDFKPAKFHHLLPTFCWKGLATTNFDLVIERAYQNYHKSVQQLVPIIKNGDRVEEKLRSSSALPFLKLHGCITYTSDPEVPLILTTDQYVTHKKGRDRVFNHLYDWAFENPIVFVGYSLEDPDIRKILLDFSNLLQRPRFYLISPSMEDPEKRFWESKRISPLIGTFEEFLSSLDDEVDSRLRGLAIASSQGTLTVTDHFKIRQPDINSATRDFLLNAVEHVRRGMPTETIEPKLFYRGFHGGWSAIEQDLDTHRKLVDTILSDAVLSDETTEISKCRLNVIKGPAGSGKSVILRRVAWEAAVEYGKLCLFARPHGRVSYDALAELSRLADERVYLFVDQASEHVAAIMDLIQKARRAGLRLTVVIAERHNEWNMSCDRLNPYVAEVFEVEYLSSSEIDNLLKLLEKHRSLGTLEKESLEERRRRFHQVAGRQLLVALHEATLGRPFEDIIADEYSEIEPDLARHMYLGICFLNRLNVPVRAGVIARVYGIRFTDFAQRLFRPLEKVVLVDESGTRDSAYLARHPHIAEIVFERALRTPHERLDTYLRFLGALNIDYDTDRVAYRKLIRARSLIDLFPDQSMVESIFKSCEQIASDDDYLFHQKAIYEMYRPNSNLEKAQRYLERARELAPHNRTIRHSFAELALRKAESASTEAAFRAYSSDARKIARENIGSKEAESHDYHTLAKVGISNVRRILGLSDEQFNDFELDRAVKETEQAIEDGLQKFPDDPYLLQAESELSALLEDEKRAVEALRKAFSTNSHDAYIAICLAKSLVKMADKDQAATVYKQALDKSPNDKRLHYNYAKLLLDSPGQVNDAIEYHLRRSFTDGDKNYDAQFWYARQLYINGKITESGQRFRVLRDCLVDPAVKMQVRRPLDIDGKRQLFKGRVTRLEPSYAFIARDGTGDVIFVHSKSVEEPMWRKLSFNTRVEFSIGFTYKGPAAINLRIE